MPMERLEAAKNVAKVDVKEPPTIGYHHIIVVPITDSHQIRRNAVPCE